MVGMIVEVKHEGIWDVMHHQFKIIHIWPKLITNITAHYNENY